MAYLASFVTALLPLCLLSDWVERRAWSVGQFEVVPEYNWVTWGRREGVWLFAIKFPSYCWGYDIFADRECWNQHVAYWVEGRGWRMTTVPVD